MEQYVNLIDVLTHNLNETTSKTIYDNWQKYLSIVPQMRKETSWMIVSDYCFDKSKYNNALSFVICPIMDINLLSNQIDYYIPQDLKHTRDISDSIINYLKFPYFFSINFAFDNIKDFENCYCPNKDKLMLSTDINNLYNSLNLQIDRTTGQDELLKKIKKIKENIKSKNFNTKDYCTILCIAFLAAYVAFFISCNAKVKKLIWFSDRGLVYNFLDGICVDLYNFFYHNMLYAPIPKPNPFGIGKENPRDNKLWYDSLVRLADYNAGTIASYDLSKNAVDKDKHATLVQNVLADNPNFNLIKIFFKDKSFQTAHVNINKIK